MLVWSIKAKEFTWPNALRANLVFVPSLDDSETLISSMAQVSLDPPEVGGKKVTTIWETSAAETLVPRLKDNVGSCPEDSPTAENVSQPGSPGRFNVNGPREVPFFSWTIAVAPSVPASPGSALMTRKFTVSNAVLG
jgi:hypothetical protein